MQRLPLAAFLGLTIVGLPALSLAQDPPPPPPPPVTEVPPAQAGEPAPPTPMAPPSRPPQDPGIPRTPPPPRDWSEEPGFQNPSAAPGPPPPATPIAGTAEGSIDTPSSALDTGVGAEDAPAADQDRAASLRIQNALLSSTGLMRVVSADSGAPGTFRMSVLSSFFSGSGVHCNAESACPGRSGEEDLKSAAARLGLSVTLLRFLEASLVLHNRATVNNYGRPELLQVLGDAAVGVKVFTPFEADSIWSYGGLAELWFLNGSGDVGLDFGATGLGITGLVTADFSRARAEERLPVRAHANLGYLLNNSSKLIEDIEGARQAPISRIERFGFGVARVDSLRAGLGVEYVHPLVTPFLEWSIDLPVNRQDYVCDTDIASAAGDGCLGNEAGFGTTPSRLSLGARFFPWEKRGLGLMLGADVGTGATSSFIEEVAPELPWMVHFGIAYSVDTEPPAPVIQRVPVETAPVAPPETAIAGVVLDARTRAPIANAVLRFEDPAVSGMVTATGGTFRSASLPPGSYSLNVTADGYRAGVCAAATALLPDGSMGPGPTALPGQPTAGPAPVECLLEALPQVGSVLGAVVSATTLAPVPGPVVRITDKLSRHLDLTADTNGAFRFENIPPGTVTLSAGAPGFLPGFVEVEVQAGAEQTARLPLMERPKQAGVVFAGGKLKLKKPLLFEAGSSALVGDALPTLGEIALVLSEHPEWIAIEIRGYTDDTQPAAQSLELGQNRADVVRDRLVLLGVDPSRLLSKGHGQADPVAPNVTDNGRAKNNRVELAISGPATK